MEILHLENSHHARQVFSSEYGGGYLKGWNLCFEDTITGLHEELYDDNGFYTYKGYEKYDFVVIDLAISMPSLTKAEICEHIKELNIPEVPMLCEADIPLWGLDYYKHVIAVRPETRKMVEEGRVILFSGHAAKIREKGLYNEKDPIYVNTRLIDRGVGDSTTELVELIKSIGSRNNRR